MVHTQTQIQCMCLYFYNNFSVSIHTFEFSLPCFEQIVVKQPDAKECIFLINYLSHYDFTVFHSTAFALHICVTVEARLHLLVSMFPYQRCSGGS